MKYLYLDDERNPKTDKPWVIVRSCPEAIRYVLSYGMPDYISFDHDLGYTETGYDFAHWLVEADLDGKINIPEQFEFNIHSANVCGAANIKGLLTSYMEMKYGKETFSTRP